MTKEQKEQGSEVYIDSNVFLYATLSEKDIGNKAREIISKIKDGYYQAYTSVLTIDELTWNAKREIGREKSADIAKDFLSLINLEFLDVNKEIILTSLDIYKNEKLDPRDAIHLASMRIKNIKTIISSDPDFDKIKGIKRLDFSKW